MFVFSLTRFGVLHSLDEISLHNLDNAIEAMEVETGKKRIYGESSVKNEGEMERPSRVQQELGLQKKKIIHIIISLDNIDTWDLREENLKEQ